MNWRLYGSLAAALIIAVLPLALSSYQLTLMNFIGLAAIVVLGLSLLTGIGGLTSFGQATFVGIGAYTTAWATLNLGISPWLSLPLSLAAAAGVSYVIGRLTLGLSGHYLPLSTMAWSLSLFYLAGNLAALGGHDGMSGVPGITVMGEALAGRGYTWLIWIFVLLSALSVQNLLKGRVGRTIRALKGRKTMLEAFGVDTAKVKVLIFVHAALLAGASGWLYAHLLQFVAATPFNLENGIQYLFMAVIGGAASVWGAIVGSGLVIVVRDWLQDIVPGLLGTTGAVEIILFGLVMVVLLQYASQGITGLFAAKQPILPKASRAVADAFAQGPKPVKGSPLMQVRDLTKRFGGLVAVNNVSFDLAAGEILGVIGPNGAGKSTLFNLLTGVAPPSSGQITLAGEALAGRPQAHFAKKGIARTFQHVKLRPEMSVLENVAIGTYLRSQKGAISAILRLDQAEEAQVFATARAQLARVGLEEYAARPAGTLALGQQRVVEIARALAADPTILLLDEPAAGLRYHEKQQLHNLLSQLRAEGVTVLIVEHDMEFVMNLVDRLVVVSFGQKIAEGAPDSVQNDPEVQKAYLGEDETKEQAA